MKIVELEGDFFLIDETKSVQPDDGWAIEIISYSRGGKWYEFNDARVVEMCLITPEQNKNCQSINQADFWNIILASTKHLDGVENMTLEEMNSKLDKLN